MADTKRKKWGLIAGVTVVVAAGIGAVLKWVVGSGVAKTTTATVLVASFTFSFADKSGWTELLDKTESAAEYAVAGQNKKSNDLLDEVEWAIRDADVDSSSDMPFDPSEEKDAAKRYVALFRAGLTLAKQAEELEALEKEQDKNKKRQEAQSAWLAVFDQQLGDADPELAERVLDVLFEQQPDFFNLARTAAIVRHRSLPEHLRETALRRAFRLSYEVKLIREVRSEFLQILAVSSDLPSAPEVLARTIELTDQLRRYEQSDQILTQMRSIFTGTELERAAGMLQLARHGENDPASHMFSTIQSQPELLTDPEVRQSYMLTLARDGRFSDAIRLLDLPSDETLLEDQASITRYTNIVWRLINARDVGGNGLAKEYASMLAASNDNELAAAYAQSLIQAEAYSVATQLAFRTLHAHRIWLEHIETRERYEDTTALPGGPSQSSSQAKWMLARLHAFNSKYTSALAWYDSALADATDPLLRAYIYCDAARACRSTKQYDRGVAYAESGLELMPEAILLIRMRDGIKHDSNNISKSKLFAQQVEMVRESVQPNDPPQYVIQSLEKVRELYQAAGYKEQAIGVSIEIADRFPGTDAARQSLQQAIDLLKADTKKPQWSRIYLLQERLDRESAINKEAS